MDDLGKGWVWRMFGILIGLGVAIILCFILISGLFARFSIIGGLIVLSIVLLLFGWLYDKREARKDREFGA